MGFVLPLNQSTALAIDHDNIRFFFFYFLIQHHYDNKVDNISCLHKVILT